MRGALLLWLADAVVILHLGFVLFVLLGGLLVLRWPRLAWMHVPSAAWGVWIELAGRVCPLTPLENWLRARAGRGVYTSSFVEQYLLPVLYPASLTWETQWVIAGAVVLVNAALYYLVLRHRR